MRRVAAVLAVAVCVTMMAPSASAGGEDHRSRNPCASWQSRWKPPRDIRILVKARGGHVVTRDFRRYVGEVMAAGAWPDSPERPNVSLEAGALAIKQYAWWEIVHRPCDRSWKGEPYDIENGGIHQLWRPRSGLRAPTRRQMKAVDAIWSLHIRKHGRFIRTGWSGGGGRCGSYTDGWHLLEDGVTDCARKGRTLREILRIYYRPRFTLHGAPPG